MYKVWKIRIPELTGQEKRKAYIYIPDSYYADLSQRYPVLYMFDGHNLFNDEEASYGKSWGILKYVTENDIPVIIAAIECNHHEETDECGGRLSEYSPFDFDIPDYCQIKGRGKITMDYFVNEFKPYIDKRYPTLPDREHTFVSGSSMGGLMTLYALCAYSDTFSRGAALSPSLDFNPAEVRKMLSEARLRGTVLYMDCGDKEFRSASERKLYAQAAALLIRKGVHLTSRIVPNGIHSESSWEKQLPFIFNTLLYEL